ncbi:unnamed protein product [Porites evermanni]|uniref:Uncharacterized protein n=1 Tax=Porites evermanni TaxID=104178 RepID=A0ABN8PJY0_9CNID|nr:unnamed protein product [Porites evermanni]
MVSTATMAPVIQDGLAPITYTALKISSAIPTCKSVGREYEGAITNNSAGQQTSARVGCVQSGSAVCTKIALVTTLANRESVRSTRVTVMRDTTTTANTDMLASTVEKCTKKECSNNYDCKIGNHCAKGFCKPIKDFCRSDGDCAEDQCCAGNGDRGGVCRDLRKPGSWCPLQSKQFSGKDQPCQSCPHAEKNEAHRCGLERSGHDHGGRRGEAITLVTRTAIDSALLHFYSKVLVPNILIANSLLYSGALGLYNEEKFELSV